jgi:excinuclease UvrABC ATPase subunit
MLACRFLSLVHKKTKKTKEHIQKLFSIGKQPDNPQTRSNHMGHPSVFRDIRIDLPSLAMVPASLLGSLLPD